MSNDIYSSFVGFKLLGAKRKFSVIRCLATDKLFDF